MSTDHKDKVVSYANLVNHGASVDGAKRSFTEEPSADNAVLTDNPLITDVMKYLHHVQAVSSITDNNKDIH